MEAMIRTLVFTLWFMFTSSDTVAQCLKMDIVLVADMSSSVRDREGYIADALDGLLDRVELSEQGIHVGLITFNSQTIIWTPQTSNKGAIRLAIDNGIRRQQPTGDTRLTNALMDALTLLSGARPDATKLIVLICDGEPNSVGESQAVAQQIKSLPGYAIFGIYIQRPYQAESTSEFMKLISTVYVETNYQALGQTIKQMDLCL